MIFANPTYLYLLLLLIPMIGWYVYKLSKNQASLQVSSTEGFDAPTVGRTLRRKVSTSCWQWISRPV